MAKIVKKKPAAKTPAKPAKKAPVKAASKPAPKKAAPKTVVKKKAEKAPAKAAPKKPEVKKKVEAKVEPKAKVSAKSVKEVKETKAEVSKKEKVEKKAAPVPAPEKAVAPKKDAKAPKKGKGKKEKEESDMDDDFIADDDAMMGDEIGEYEEELKAVEESEEEIEVIEDWTAEEKDKSDEEIVLTDAEGRRYCRARDCDQVAVVDVYCRYHYLLFWKKIQVRKKILTDGKLERYVEELTSRYPDKFLEMIRRDLRTEKDFLAAIQELEIDESAGEGEFEEDTNAFIEEVRGMGDSGGSVSDDDEY
ncbi:hypothetical protein [Bdellovibrio sp. GT3]|uniref:hypothetical protein n=1 Tax=Bdellovibrio sp. GT3 TaxID=3136282 RepID=UPI0030F209D2